MSEGLTKVLASAEGFYPPLFSFDDVESWPAGELELCVESGLLRLGKPAVALTCFECGETEEVVFVQDAVSKQTHAYTRCAEVGPVEVPLERLRQWETSYLQLMDTLFAGVKLIGQRQEVVRDRVWLLGKTRWAGGSRNVFFARGLHRRDAWQVMNKANLTPRSVVFVPARLPEEDSRIKIMPPVIPLNAVVAWKDRALQFDQRYVESEVAGMVARLDDEAGGKRAMAARGSRLAVIEALTQEMQEHLRAARDHALETLERTGTPQLLPRPQRDFLAKELGVHKSSVTRAFRDSEARELQFLWELAGDLDRLLNHAVC